MCQGSGTESSTSLRVSSLAAEVHVKQQPERILCRVHTCHAGNATRVLRQKHATRRKMQICRNLRHEKRTGAVLEGRLSLKSNFKYLRLIVKVPAYLLENIVECEDD